MSTYLITGVAGFIGSSLARAVLKQGDRVRGIDNFSTGKPENLQEIFKQIDFREADILDLDAMNKACESVDYVLHQAAIPSVPKSVLDPLGSNRANVDGDRKSTRLNSSHVSISYAVFCLKKKK